MDNHHKCDHKYPAGLNCLGLACLVFALVPAPLGAEGLLSSFALGGKAFSSYSRALPGSSLADSGSFQVEPLLSLSGAFGGGLVSWEARGSWWLAGSTEPRGTEFLPSNSSLALSAGPARLELGYGVDASPAAEFFPLLAFLGPVDPLAALASGGQAGRRKPEVFGSLGLAFDLPFGGLSAKTLWAPFAPPLVPPDPSSPWFPPGLLPATITYGSSYQLASSAWAYEPASTWALDPAWRAELAWNLADLDLGLVWFHGRERRASAWAELSLATPGPRDYSVTLLARRAIFDCIGVHSTLILGGLRLWGEVALSLGTSRVTGTFTLRGIPDFFIDPSLPGALAPPPVEPRDSLAGTFGASWSRSLGDFGLKTFAEFTWTSFLGPDDPEAPLLSRALALGLSLTGPGDRGELGSALLFSLKDGSLALRPVLTLDLGEGQRLSLSLPLFAGGGGTELGGYSALQALKIDLVMER